MSDPDSLVATRARRANAGSRLKQLIEIEEQATGVSNIVYSEDDENVQLLFQEDENDEEFEESDVGDSDIDEEEEEEQQEENEGEEIENSAAEKLDNDDLNKGDKTSDVELAVNSDEMLSDSDLSASENDDSEGERELQKIEKEKKRKTKTSSIIPAIKKPKLSTEKPKPKPKSKTKHSELLLNLDRRASSRKSAMRNKEILVQKLKEDETRRAALTPVVRVDEVKLTQEERLAQAVETEKENVLSLHSFLEQEIVKKEHQKLLFQQRRRKLRNVIRLVSKETFVAPIDEIEDALHVQDLFDKKKKGRRRKTGSDVPDEPRPGDIDKELPYYKKEMEEKRIREEKEEAERQRVEQELEEERRKVAEEEEKRNLELQKEIDLKNIEDPTAAENSSNEQEDNIKAQDGDLETLPSEADHQVSDAVQTKTEGDLEIHPDQEHDENEQEVVQMEIDEEKAVPAVPETTAAATDIMQIQDESNEAEVVKQDAETEKGTQDEGVSEEGLKPDVLTNLESGDDTLVNDVPTEQKQATIEEKKVTFADDHDKVEDDQLEEISDHKEEIDDGLDIDVSYRASKDGFVFEGPVQQVSRNNIFLLDFDEEEYPYLTETKIKTLLFGKDANLGASRRFKDVKTILKSSIRLDNPYAAPKEEKEDDRLKPVTEITEDDIMFEALKRLPRLGVKETFEEEEEDVQKEEATEIQIRTEAPSGLYLPNGNKKLCLISGKEVRYFDPATGLPYENKDVYKVIKTIEQGLIPWYSIGKDQNTYGEIEIYLNHRNGSRHAKGVPEGFDGC